LRKDIALRLKAEAERVAREYSNPLRERGNGEVFEVDERKLYSRTPRLEIRILEIEEQK
jgi:hypothetical protein